MNNSVEKERKRKEIRQEMENSLSKRKTQLADSIPGVKKFYLNQAKAIATKKNEVLKYRGS